MELIRSASLIEQLLDAHYGNKRELARPRGKNRGYMGHVYRIANILCEAAETDGAVNALISIYSEWTAFVQELHEVNRTQLRPIGE